MSSQFRNTSHAAITCIPTGLVCNDFEALRKAVTCRAMLHNRVEEACRILSQANNPVVRFGVDIAVSEPGEAKGAASKQEFKMALRQAILKTSDEILLELLFLV